MDDGMPERSESDLDLEVTDISHSGHLRASRSRLQSRSPLQRFRRLLTAIGIMALLLVVVALDLSGRLNPEQFIPEPPAPLTLRPQLEGMTCLIDAAWSLAGTRIALLGDQHALSCPASTVARQSGLVTVFDTTSGRLLATLHPDDAIVGAIETFARHVAPGSIPSAEQIAAVITYRKVLWSPDDNQLALTFSFEPTSTQMNLHVPSGQPDDLQGVLLLDTNGAHPKVILHVVKELYGLSPLEWDIHTGTSVATPPAAAYPAFGVLMPALIYRWQTDATPVSLIPLTSVVPPSAPPPGPVGNPDGGRSFTIWQPGVVTGVGPPGDDGQLNYLPGVYQLNGAFVVWSPDGRYLLDSVIPQALLELPGTPLPTPDQLSASGMDGVPLLPVRDTGLAQALRAQNPINLIGMYVAWRPDGRVLASYAPQTLLAVPPVSLFDCATGRRLNVALPPTLGEPSIAPPLPGQSTLLRWSPDGKHLLLYALPLGQVVLFGPQQLAP
jgi:hypothetical protein